MNYPIKHFPFYPSSTLPFGNKIDNSFCPSSARITGNIHTHPGLANDRTDGTRTPVPTGSSDGFSEKCTLPDYPPPVSQHVLAELSFLTSSFPEGPYDIFPTASCNSLPLLPNTSTDCLAYANMMGNPRARSGAPNNLTPPYNSPQNQYFPTSISPKTNVVSPSVQPETLQLSIEVLRREFKAILQQSFRDRADEFVDILDRSIQEVDRTKGYIPQQTFDALCVFLQKNLPPEAMQIFFCAKNAALGSHYHGWRQRLRRIRRTLGNGNTIATSDLRAVLAPKLRKQKNGKFLLAVFEKFLDNSGIGDVLYPENCVALQFALAIVFGPEVGTQFALSLPSVPGGQNRRFVKKMAQCAKALSLSQVTNAPPPTAQSESGDRPPGLWDDDDLDWVTI